MTPLIDTNTFLGAWPFSVAPVLTAAQFARRLTAAGVNSAWVSPLHAVFSPDPMPGNRALFAAVRARPAFLPVPVLNPVLATWREHLAACRASAPIRAVRLLPNYHGYELSSRKLMPFMDALRATNLRLVLAARLEDERQTYFALRIKGTPIEHLGVFLNRFPSHHVLCTGLYMAEIERLATIARNFSAEISFAESKATLLSLRQSLPADRLMFGSGAPLLSMHAQVAKLRTPAIPRAERILVAGKNAARFLDL